MSRCEECGRPATHRAIVETVGQVPTRRLLCRDCTVQLREQLRGPRLWIELLDGRSRER